MNSKSKTVLAIIVGAALGGATVHGLHAQAKPKAYTVSELEVIDAVALKGYSPVVQAAQKGGGGRPLGTAGGKIVGFVGDPPKRVTIIDGIA